MSLDLPTFTLARLVRVLENRLKAEPLSLPQYRVLGLLTSSNERVSELASRLSVTKPAMTAVVDSLVERGFVTRETSPDDRRSVRLSITPTGEDAVSETGIALRTVLDDVLAHCERPDDALAVLEDLRKGLDERWAQRDAAKADRAGSRA